MSQKSLDRIALNVQQGVGAAANTFIRFSGSHGETEATQSGSAGGVCTSDDKVIGCLAIPAITISPGPALQLIPASAVTLGATPGWGKISVSTTGKVVILIWHNVSA